MIEYELRKLEIDIDGIISKLDSLGAKHIAERSFRRHVFDVIPAVNNTWIRLRTDGSVTTLTVKQIKADTVDGTHEWETKVDDFDATFELLKIIGFKSHGYQENRRSEYKLYDVQVCIDEWPQIPPYLELEGSDENSILSVASKLGIQKGELTGLNNQDIYKKYGIDITKILILKFK